MVQAEFCRSGAPAAIKRSQTTSHRPEGGAPTKSSAETECLRRFVQTEFCRSGAPAAIKRLQTTSHRPEGGAPAKNSAQTKGNP